MKKWQKVFLIVSGVLLILGGLLLMIVSFATGFIFAALGVLAIVFAKKYKPKESVTNTVETSAPVIETTNVKTETIRVAGISNYTDAVLSLGDENDEYNYSKREIIENGLEDEDIPKYYFSTLPAEFVYEPNNPYDSNAIAIYVNGEKIGYVKSGSIAHIRKLIENDRIKDASCEIVGGKMKRYDSDTETVEKIDLDYGARITLTIKSEDEQDNKEKEL